MITEGINVELIDYMGSDLSVVNSARVSFNKVSKEFSDKDDRLVQYLASNGHWSPFTHTSISFRCKAPIFLARQLVKHQVGGSWNEVSRRYVDDEPTFYIPKHFHTRPEDSIKQGCGGIILNPAILKLIVESTNSSLRAYAKLLHSNVAPEEARMVLPLNTMTEWVWTGSLYFFARVYNQRIDNHAQLAAQEFAMKINKSVPKAFKSSWKALTKKDNSNDIH